MFIQLHRSALFFFAPTSAHLLRRLANARQIVISHPHVVVQQQQRSACWLIAVETQFAFVLLTLLHFTHAADLRWLTVVFQLINDFILYYWISLSG